MLLGRAFRVQGRKARSGKGHGGTGRGGIGRGGKRRGGRYKYYIANALKNL